MNKHKHYQAIRAYADGWRVLESYGYDLYEPPATPNFGHSDYDFEIVPDEAGWLPWYPSDQVPCDGPVDIKWNNNSNRTGYFQSARDVDWEDVDISHYKPYKKPKLREKLEVFSACARVFQFEDWVRNYPHMKNSWECREAFEAGKKAYKDLFTRYFRLFTDNLIDDLAAKDEHGISMMEYIKHSDPELIERLISVLDGKQATKDDTLILDDD